MNKRFPDSGQEKTDLALTGPDGENAADMSEKIGEGERLARLLAVKRYQKKELADAIPVTKQSVNDWLKLEKFSARVWEKIERGLRTLGLDPAEVRPTNHGTDEPVEDLTRLVENYSRVQLLTLKRILEADATSRRVLLAYIDGALRQIPQ